MDIASVSEGMTVGVSAGLMLGLLHWLKSVVQARYERRGQIRHLARTIEHARDMIYTASDLDFTEHPIGRRVSKDELRKAYLRELHRQIQQILSGRAGHLKFDEIQQVSQVFIVVELYPSWVPNERGYDGIFKQLTSIQWLKLQPRS